MRRAGAEEKPPIAVERMTNLQVILTAELEMDLSCLKAEIHLVDEFRGMCLSLCMSVSSVELI